VGNDVKKIIAFLARQRDKSKRKILNVYQIGRFLFYQKEKFVTRQNYGNDQTKILQEEYFRAVNNNIIKSR